MSRRKFLSATAGATLLSQVPGRSQGAKDVTPFDSSPPTHPRIDDHTHVFNHSPQFYAMLKRQNMHIMDINVIDRFDRGYEALEPQQTQAIQVMQNSHGWVAWCSTFDPLGWETPGFAQRVSSHLNGTFDEGAIAVKMYKEIGMLLVSRTGKYLMPDDPAFDPILDDIQAHGKTLTTHFADEDEAWEPIDPASPTYPYFRDNPMWHMYLFPDRPSKEAILAARDRMVARHPRLRVIGFHLGSMEHNVDEVARRLDLYPNFAVDTAAEMIALMLQPREKVRAFLTKYQDRVLYGTDLEYMPWAKAEETVRGWKAVYSRDWKLFSTDEPFTYKGRQTRGLALPEPVLRKIYYENAVKWLPGIVGSR